MRVYNAKLGTQPAFVQLRYKYALREGDRVLYRGVERTGSSFVDYYPIEKWQEGIVDEEYPYPHNHRNLLRLSKA